MARGIGSVRGSTDNDSVASAYTGYSTTQTWLIWFNRNGEGELGFGRMVDQQASVIAISNNNGNVANTYSFIHGRATTTGAWRWTRPAANTWGPIVVVYDNALEANTPVVFTGPSTKLVVGSGLTQYSTPAGAATSTSGSAVYIGNRSDAARCANGDCAWFAKWDVLLTDDEAYALCRGVNPLKIRPASLAECHPLWGLHSSEISLKGNTAATLAGTAPRNPPPVQPYTRNWQAFFDTGGATNHVFSGTYTMKFSDASVDAAGDVTAYTMKLSDADVLAVSMADATTLKLSDTDVLAAAKILTDLLKLLDAGALGGQAFEGSYTDSIGLIESAMLAAGMSKVDEIAFLESQLIWGDESCAVTYVAVDRTCAVGVAFSRPAGGDVLFRPMSFRGNYASFESDVMSLSDAVETVPGYGLRLSETLARSAGKILSDTLRLTEALIISGNLNKTAVDTLRLSTGGVLDTVFGHGGFGQLGFGGTTNVSG